MATWSGWVAQFLSAANVLNTPPNQRFLNNWASHAQAPSCHNNPVDLSVKVGASANCVKPAGDFPWIQRYASHANAATAFDRQVHTSFASDILAALDSGNPFQYKDWQDVVGQLRQWGSGRFADWYMAQVQGTGSGGGGTLRAPHALSAWSDLQRSMNHGLPTMLRQTGGLNRATRNLIARKRRVRR